MHTLYKICPAALWREAEPDGVFHGSEVDRRDNFIHFSTAGQVAETAADLGECKAELTRMKRAATRKRA